MSLSSSENAQRPFSRKCILRQHAVGKLSASTAQRVPPSAGQCIIDHQGSDSVEQRLTGGSFSTLIVDRGFASPVKPTNLSYEITRGAEAGMADRILSRPASRAESPFGVAGSRFGSRQQSGRQYFCNDGKPYFGQDEIFEDQHFLLSHLERPLERRAQTVASEDCRESSSRVDSEASLLLSTQTMGVLRMKAQNARLTAAKAAARRKVKRTRTSAASQAARDDSVYETLPRRMVRRLKAMEAATASTAFGSSGGRYDNGVLGVSNDTLRQVDVGPGMYSDADTDSIAAKLARFNKRSLQRAQSARLRCPSMTGTKSNSGTIGFHSTTPGVGTYLLPELPPVGYAVQWSSQPRWGRGSLGHIDKSNSYKLSSTAGSHGAPLWILPNKAPFSKVGMQSRNPMFDQRRENCNIPYPSARNVTAPSFWDYPSALKPKGGIAESASQKDIHRSARMSKSGGSRSLGREPRASDIAGLGPGSYGVPLDRKLSGAFRVKHVVPKEARTKRNHWLTHTGGDWKLRY